MYKLEEGNYSKVLPLIQSRNELSVYSVIAGIMPGEIFVNSISNPTAALIRTSECNYIAGKTGDAEFNASAAAELDFWDQITPDTEEWYDSIPAVHENKFIREYARRHYVLEKADMSVISAALPEDCTLEEISPSALKKAHYENADALLDWIKDWGDDENFCRYGAGTYIRKDNIIMSWSLSDCSYQDRIAIGIHTDERYRKRGLGAVTAAATVRKCFERGYRQVEWLCVDKNKGSAAIAEKLGFTLSSRYRAYTSYPPIENQRDLTETEWLSWAEYYEGAVKEEPRLRIECLFAYIKADNPCKACQILMDIERNGQTVSYNIDGLIQYLHRLGIAGKFSEGWYKDMIGHRGYHNSNS